MFISPSPTSATSATSASSADAREWMRAFDVARMGSRKAARNTRAFQAQSSQSVAVKAAASGPAVSGLPVEI
jgi:hypothetical protein